MHDFLDRCKPIKVTDKKKCFNPDTNIRHRRMPNISISIKISIPTQYFRG